EHEPQTGAAMDLIFFDCFRRNEPGVFSEIPDVPLACSDCMPLADVTSCLEAGQPTTELYADPDAWARTAILNVASCGKLSRDGTIAEQAGDKLEGATVSSAGEEGLARISDLSDPRRRTGL